MNQDKDVSPAFDTYTIHMTLESNIFSSAQYVHSHNNKSILFFHYLYIFSFLNFLIRW